MKMVADALPVGWHHPDIKQNQMLQNEWKMMGNIDNQFKCYLYISFIISSIYEIVPSEV